MNLGTVLLGKARSILFANAWIEDEFERGRAGRSESPTQALFATGHPADSIKYLRVEQDFGLAKKVLRTCRRILVKVGLFLKWHCFWKAG
jgi:hypothetical protein